MHHEEPPPTRVESEPPVTTVQLAERLRVSRHDIVYHIRAGHIAAMKSGRDWLIDPAEARRFAESYARGQGWQERSTRTQQVGLRVKRLRAARGWSQGQLAAKAYLSKSTVARMERRAAGRMRRGNLEALARALGVTVAELEGRAGQEAQSA